MPGRSGQPQNSSHRSGAAQPTLCRSVFAGSSGIKVFDAVRRVWTVRVASLYSTAGRVRETSRGENRVQFRVRVTWSQG